MRIYNRPYDEMNHDFKRMWDFLVQDYTDKKEYYIWSIGRLGDWYYGLWTEKKFFPNYKRKNAQLWLDNFNQLVGFSISEGCDSYFSIVVRRGYEFLYREIIQWVKQNWGDREGDLHTDVNESQTEYMAALQEEGFQIGDLIAITRQYKLSDKIKEGMNLCDDYHFEDMQTNPDYKGKIILGNNAWSGRDDIKELDFLQYEYIRENPCFYPQYDISVVDSKGTHLSSCMAFVDFKNNVAEIEKICTHSGYRRLGLAEAAVRECFRRLYRDGVEVAYITGFSTEAKNLYEKLGANKSINIFRAQPTKGIAGK